MSRSKTLWRLVQFTLPRRWHPIRHTLYHTIAFVCLCFCDIRTNVNSICVPVWFFVVVAFCLITSYWFSDDHFTSKAHSVCNWYKISGEGGKKRKRKPENSPFVFCARDSFLNFNCGLWPDRCRCATAICVSKCGIGDLELCAATHFMFIEPAVMGSIVIITIIILFAWIEVNQFNRSLSIISLQRTNLL